MGRHWVDITAVGFFIIEWLVYALTLEHSAYGRDSLSARMNRYREVWVRRLLDRDTRMVDMQIMASLQNGTAFFASTSLFALGGALALLHATNDAITILEQAADRPQPLARNVGAEMRRPRADLRLRLLQIRLGLSPVQLCRDPVRRHAAG